jgi:hypothetical protein
MHNWVAKLGRAPIILAIGDALIFVFFAAQGRATHEMGLGTSPILTVLAVAAPFAVPWFALAALLGLYRDDIITRPVRMTFWTAVVWVSAGSIGLVIRTLLLDRPLVPQFAAAVLGINAALLLAWRLIASFVLPRLSRRQARA